MTEVSHRRHRHGMPQGDERLLRSPEAQAVVARIDAATDADYPDRKAHIGMIATICLKAKAIGNGYTVERVEPEE